MKRTSLLCLLFDLAFGAVLWNGNFNSYATSTDLDKWSFSSRTGEWQTYIFNGNQASKWMTLDTSYKNPWDGDAKQGVRVTITDQSSWNGQQMMRTELIPELQNIANVQTGVRYYRWSMKQGDTNQLDSTNEHQVVFWEAHFADIKYGGSGGANLYFYVNGKSLWQAPFTANVWQNFAIKVDYNARTVSLYHSTGGDAMTEVVPTTAASVSQSDWHVGILRLPGGTVGTQQVYYSSAQIADTLNQIQGGSGQDPSDASALVIAFSCFIFALIL